MSDENPHPHDRDRILSFLLAPVLTAFITQALLTLLVFAGAGILSFVRSLPFEEAGRISESFFNSLGVPIASLSLVLVMVSPAVRGVLRFNGGLHASFRGSGLHEDMRTTSTPKAWVKITVISVFGAMAVWSGLTLAINLLAESGADASGNSATTQSVSESSSLPYGWVVILFSLVFAPIAEELFFRSFLSRSLVSTSLLRRENGTRAWWSNLLISLICGLWFGLGHLNTAETNLSRMIVTTVFMTLFGALLTWVSTIRYKSVLPAIGLHICYNAIVLLTM